MEDRAIQHTVARQYRASLAMLRQAIELCPEPLWLSEDHRNRYWHIAYHTVFYTHLYLQPSEADFRAWPKHRKDSQYLGPRPSAPGETRKVEPPCTKAEVIEYLELCRSEVEARVPGLDLAAASGFSWLPFNKLEVQFYNIRHLQHHTGQLADRLRTAAGIGVAWVRPD
jgi:DinB superfamily